MVPATSRPGGGALGPRASRPLDAAAGGTPAVPGTARFAAQSLLTREKPRMARLKVNGKTYDVDVGPDTPLLWAIRENIGLTGTKYGCGIAQCGACTVHIDGVPTRSCSILA